jgi:hypothetical protein
MKLAMWATPTCQAGLKSALMKKTPGSKGKVRGLSATGCPSNLF